MRRLSLILLNVLLSALRLAGNGNTVYDPLSAVYSTGIPTLGRFLYDVAQNGGGIAEATLQLQNRLNIFLF